MKTLLIGLSLGVATLSGAVAADPAEARSRGHYQEYRPGDYYGDYRHQSDRRYYRDRRAYRDDRRYYRDRNYRRCDSGTGGTIIGAIAGGLLGSEIAGRNGDKTAGVIIGGAVGAVAGRAIDRDC